MSAPTHDITLNGDKYMLIPGTYRSYPDGNLYVDSRLQRQILTDFTAGMAGPKLNARNLPASSVYGEQSVGAWPASWPLGVNAIGPAPALHASGLLAHSDEPKVFARIGTNLFIAAGERLYRYDNAGNLTLRYTASNPIVDMCARGPDLFLAFGTAQALARWVDATGTITLNAIGSGMFISIVRSISRWVIGQHADEPNSIRVVIPSLGSSQQQQLDGPSRNAVVYDDAILFATERGLWALRPTSTSAHTFTHWGVVSSDGMANADDHIWMTVFQGRLMTWLGGRAVVYDKQRGWWRHAGFEAAESYGAALVNGWLIVSARPRGSTDVQLWGYNGSGWWLMSDHDAGRWIAASRGDRLVGFKANDDELHYWNMDAGRDPAEVAEDVTVESTLIDGNDPTQPKFWTRIGVELARADPAAVGSWDVQLSYSLDAGTTWTTAGAPETVTGAVATVSVPVGASSSYLRVKVELEQDTGLPPHILALWAEYEVLGDSVRRRRWQFSIAATDRTLTRAGALDTRDGDEIRSDLWDLWSGPASFAFTDVDGQSHTVRLIGLREEWQRPDQAPKVGAHTTFDVVLVEL